MNKVEEFIPKGLIISDNADSLKILNSEEEMEEEALISELIEISKHAMNAEFLIESMINSQAYRKVEYRKAEILRRLNDGKHN